MNFTRRIQLAPLVNLREIKWPMINSVYCSFLLLLLIIIFNRNSSFTESYSENYSPSDFLFEIKLENGAVVNFFVNNSNGVLYRISMVQNNVAHNFNVFDAYEITKALSQCYVGKLCKISRNSSADVRNCLYYSHLYLLKFCYINTRNLSHVVLFDKITLSTYDVKRFLTAVKLFIKV